jgi:hypothetical protein
MIRPRDVQIDQVMISDAGKAISPRAAAERQCPTAVLLLRADGWVLATSWAFVDVADKLWHDEWVAWAMRETDEWYTMDALAPVLATPERVRA